MHTGWVLVCANPFPLSRVQSTMSARASLPGSKIDVEALRNRARAEQFPSALQKGDNAIMCVRPGLEISESEDVTVRHAPRT